MEKRLIIALALSLLVLVAFQKFFKPPRKPVVRAQGTAVQTADRPAPGSTAEAPEQTAGSFAAREEKAVDEKTLLVETDKQIIVFSNAGGAIKSISLKEYREEDEKEQQLFDAAPGEAVFQTRSAAFPQIQSGEYELTKNERGIIEYRLTEPGELEIIKRYQVHKSLDYMDLEISIRNLKKKDTVFSYEIQGPAGLLRTDKIMGRNFLEAAAMIGDKVWREKSVKEPEERTGDIAWLALKNRYFAVIVRPFKSPRSVIVSKEGDKNLSVSARNKAVTIRPKDMVRDSYLLYAGAINEKELAGLGHGMDQIADYGIFGGVSKFLLSALRFFHKGVKNWGLAIILLTLLINGILFPLTKKSVVSMHQMKKIQPHMQKLKELHKDNPQKLNKEMMELYKQYNVNPLSGCLPLILQMPVFIALYQGLIRSIELKGASFLWIKDLSRPDAVGLPFSLPAIGASINILPLLMVGMMVLQQKISQGAVQAVSSEQAQQQKMMMFIFPIVFGFLFYKMPAGLVLYWLTNTILMTTEQKLLAKSIDRE